MVKCRKRIKHIICKPVNDVSLRQLKLLVHVGKRQVLQKLYTFYGFHLMWFDSVHLFKFSCCKTFLTKGNEYE